MSGQRRCFYCGKRGPESEFLHRTMAPRSACLVCCRNGFIASLDTIVGKAAPAEPNTGAAHDHLRGER
jgi:hypothetical protein